jgi:GntR family transcriptional regulator
MQFRASQAIYLQIADYVCEKILLKAWIEGERVPSVRELAVELEVNPNTVMRAFEFLQQEQVIFNQRGVGYFAAADAIQKATGYLRTAFIERDLPQLFRSLYLLGMEPDELRPRYERYKQQFFNA